MGYVALVETTWRLWEKAKLTGILFGRNVLTANAYRVASDVR